VPGGGGGGGGGGETPTATLENARNRRRIRRPIHAKKRASTSFAFLVRIDVMLGCYPVLEAFELEFEFGTAHIEAGRN
jgi:hypothetical protein